MINLMPPKMKKEIVAGQTNVILWRYCVMSLVLAGLLLLMIGGVFFLMTSSKMTAKNDIAAGNRRIDENKETQEKYDSFSKNLAIAKYILGRDVKYSTLAIKIAQALPSNIILDTLSLDSKSFDKPIVLSAAGKSHIDAVRLKDSFEKAKFFKDVNIASVTYVKDDRSGYTYKIKMNVTIVSGEALNG